jgi:Cdc6-like AAA superfamily ATPase
MNKVFIIAIVICIVMALISNAFFVWSGIAALLSIAYGANYYLKRPKKKRRLLAPPTSTQHVETLPTGVMSVKQFDLIFNDCIEPTLPSIDLLTKNVMKFSSNTYINKLAKRIVEYYEESCNIKLEFDSAQRGVRLDTLRFREIKADNQKRLKARQITNEREDLARNLSLDAGDIQFATTMAGHDTIGIILPSDKMNKIRLSNFFRDNAFMQYVKDNQILKNGECVLNDMPIVLGLDGAGNNRWTSPKTAPNWLIAGATGSGKSVALNSLLTALLMMHTEKTLHLYLADLKSGIELADFSKVPHCQKFCDTTEQVIEMLSELETEMDRRNRLIRGAGKKSIFEYNKLSSKEFLPFAFIVLEEYVSLSHSDIVTEHLVELSSKGRSAGIFLCITLQQPRVNTLDGRIRSNLNTRIAFRTADQNESRIILDVNDASELNGAGDGYFKTPSDGLVRFQGVFINDSGEGSKIINWWTKHGT